jgi:cytochrome o ubiquinol oxidase subunit 1
MMRCKGMKLMKMPIFTWAVFATVILIVLAFPILTGNLTMLMTDRLLDTHIFTAEKGGNPMMYINLFWAWGHPEVYILILPAFGIFSEVVPVFSRKALFGYTSMVWAIVAITVLSFIVWLHHFFTMGAGPTVNAFFGIMTMIIAVPTGVKVFNWLFTMFRGSVVFHQSMYWFLGFIITFTIGGATGVLMAIPAADYQVHNSLFLVAHFHNVIIGGVLFGIFAGFSYWFPKFFGFRLDERIGKYAFWCWLIGFLLAFLPLYALGFMGVTRRLNHFENPGWQPLFIVAGIGALLIFAGFGLQILQIFISYKRRDELRDTTGDPWDGRSLEWSISSPPPEYNFATLPQVNSRDPFWHAKREGSSIYPNQEIKDIHMPKNTPYGFYIGVLSFTLTFGLIWYLFWLSAISAIGVLCCIVKHLLEKDKDYFIPAETVKQLKVGKHGSKS